MKEEGGLTYVLVSWRFSHVVSEESIHRNMGKSCCPCRGNASYSLETGGDGRGQRRHSASRGGRDGGKVTSFLPES